ncbi:MAG TPA: hypothetical protein VGD65_08455 [Chryseosolibacter sp.]
MKTTKIFLFMMITAIALGLVLSSCEMNPEVNSQQDILPETFRVEIPSAIMEQSVSGGRLARVKGDSLKGNHIYLHLATFIAIGDGAANLVEAFINGIRKHKIDRIMNLTYKSDEDDRIKNLVVTSDVTFENQQWDYQLTITDADSEGAADGGKALQIFWNKTAPVKGIAIIKPYNCNRIESANVPNAIFRINYTEESNTKYDAQMEVLVAGLPLANPLVDPYSVSTIRMFAGKKGDVVDVFGNSNHPNAILFAGDAGFNWAFVASGNEVKNIGVAEVGLPPSELNSDDRDVILKEYSIKNVFTREITAAWPGVDQTLLAAYLSNTNAPGYFSESRGFISGGTSPGADWDVLVDRLDDLGPYNPSQVSALQLNFK